MVTQLKDVLSSVVSFEIEEVEKGFGIAHVKVELRNRDTTIPVSVRMNAELSSAKGTLDNTKTIRGWEYNAVNGILFFTIGVLMDSSKEMNYVFVGDLFIGKTGRTDFIVEKKVASNRGLDFNITNTVVNDKVYTDVKIVYKDDGKRPTKAALALPYVSAMNTSDGRTIPESVSYDPVTGIMNIVTKVNERYDKATMVNYSFSVDVVADNITIERLNINCKSNNTGGWKLYPQLAKFDGYGNLEVEFKYYNSAGILSERMILDRTLKFSDGIRNESGITSWERNHANKSVIIKFGVMLYDPRNVSYRLCGNLIIDGIAVPYYYDLSLPSVKTELISIDTDVPDFFVATHKLTSGDNKILHGIQPSSLFVIGSGVSDPIKQDVQRVSYDSLNGILTTRIPKSLISEDKSTELDVSVIATIPTMLERPVKIDFPILNKLGTKGPVILKLVEGLEEKGAYTRNFSVAFKDGTIPPSLKLLWNESNYGNSEYDGSIEYANYNAQEGILTVKIKPINNDHVEQTLNVTVEAPDYEDVPKTKYIDKFFSGSKSFPSKITQTETMRNSDETISILVFTALKDGSYPSNVTVGNVDLYAGAGVGEGKIISQSYDVNNGCIAIRVPPLILTADPIYHISLMIRSKDEKEVDIRTSIVTVNQVKNKTVAFALSDQNYDTDTKEVTVNFTATYGGTAPILGAKIDEDSIVLTGASVEHIHVNYDPTKCQGSIVFKIKDETDLKRLIVQADIKLEDPLGSIHEIPIPLIDIWCVEKLTANYLTSSYDWYRGCLVVGWIFIDHEGRHPKSIKYTPTAWNDAKGISTISSEMKYNSRTGVGIIEFPCYADQYTDNHYFGKSKFSFPMPNDREYPLELDLVIEKVADKPVKLSVNLTGAPEFDSLNKSVNLYYSVTDSTNAPVNELSIGVINPGKGVLITDDAVNFKGENGKFILTLKLDWDGKVPVIFDGSIIVNGANGTMSDEIKFGGSRSSNGITEVFDVVRIEGRNQIGFITATRENGELTIPEYRSFINMNENILNNGCEIIDRRDLGYVMFVFDAVVSLKRDMWYEVDMVNLENQLTKFHMHLVGKQKPYKKATAKLDHTHYDKSNDIRTFFIFIKHEDGSIPAEINATITDLRSIDGFLNAVELEDQEYNSYSGTLTVSIKCEWDSRPEFPGPMENVKFNLMVSTPYTREVATYDI